MLGVSLIIIAAAIVYMVETYISTYYTIEYMHGTSLFLILLAKYGTVVSYQCHSMDEAVDMVAALYNGRKTEAAQA